MFRKRKHLGLDRRRYCGQAAKSRQKAHSGKALEAACASRAVENGRILDPEALGFAIKSELGPWEGDLFTTIKAAGSGIALRLFKLPLLKKGELEEAVKFESENVLPFRLSEVFLGLRSIQSQRPPGSFGSCSRKTNCGAEPCSSLQQQDYPSGLELGPLALVRSAAQAAGRRNCSCAGAGGLLLGTDHLQQRRPVFSGSARGTSSRPPQCSGRRGSCVPWGTGAGSAPLFRFYGCPSGMSRWTSCSLQAMEQQCQSWLPFSKDNWAWKLSWGIPLDLCATKAAKPRLNLLWRWVWL